MNMNVSQHRRLDVLAKLRRHLARFVFVSDDKRLAHSGFRDAFGAVRWFAGSGSGEGTAASPAKSTRLNKSVGRRLPIRSFSKRFDVFSGKPSIEPETSTTKMYSRGGIASALTRAGGWAM